MTNLQIIFLIAIVIVIISKIFILGWFKSTQSKELVERDKKTRELFQLLLFHLTVLNVDSFNNWFQNNKDKSIYAHSGIYLRTDKLSRGHIKDYLRVITNGLLSIEDFNELEIMKFEDKIRVSWIKQLNDKSK